MGHDLSGQTREAVEFGRAVTLHRRVCSCGWRSLWHGTEIPAANAAARHMAAAVVTPPQHDPAECLCESCIARYCAAEQEVKDADAVSGK